MLKQCAIYLLLSILVVVFSEHAQLLIVYIDMFYTWVNVKLTPIFSSSHLGQLIRNILTLTFIPLVIAFIPAGAYRLIKGKSMPHFIALTWLLWLVLVLSKVLI